MKQCFSISLSLTKGAYHFAGEGRFCFEYYDFQTATDA